MLKASIKWHVLSISIEILFNAVQSVIYRLQAVFENERRHIEQGLGSYVRKRFLFKRIIGMMKGLVSRRSKASSEDIMSEGAVCLAIGRNSDRQKGNEDEFTTQLSRVSNWVHFQQDLISTTPPRLPLKTEVDIDSAVGILNEKINDSYSKNTIVSSSKLIKNPKTKALIREKNKARKRWQTTWDPAHRATYLNLQGMVNQAL
ncbi:hypothetical protein LAZ67_9001312 [Cordylochernes scorpioides]|uniref:Uncharacterized protein n=1 Tax=Cordylochernes scorpioides TaxID=51811 RepID=A0ABY6KSW7_9ARAC|nr:hypothetical protein LAZ67_9001312 [Cordylochernes scorpioides]